MRILASILGCALAAPVSAADVPAAELSAIEFAQTVPAPGMAKLLGHDGKRFFLSYPDGSIKVTGAGRDAPPIVLRAKSRSGEAILERPEAAVVSNDTIYAVDRELSRIAMFGSDGRYLGSFGREGSDLGELRAPQGIALSDGIVYVADSGNGRIQLYGDNGVFLETLEIDRAPANKAARAKKLPYQLNRPIGIALDPFGRAIYVLDSETAFFVSSTSIKTYGLDGSFLGLVQKQGNPIAISATPDGLYAAERDSYRILKYDLNGRLVGAFGSRGEGRAQFRSMDGLAADSEHVHVGDRARGAIFDFRTRAAPPPSALGPQQATRTFVRWTASIPTSTAKLAWDGKGTLYSMDGNGAILRIRSGAVEGELKPKAKDLVPVACAIDQGGALWVLDKSKARVVKLDAAGNTLAEFGSAGSENGQFDHPGDLAISSSGIVYVADTGNHRVQSFSEDGAFLSVIGGTSGKLKEPAAISLDPQGNLYVLDAERAIVSVYSRSGETLAEFGQDSADSYASLKKPRGLMATRDEVFVVEAGRIKVYSHDGKYLRAFGAPGKGRGEFVDASAIAAKDATSFFIADSGNRRIQAFTTLFKPAPPAQVTAQGRAHAVELHWTASPLPYVARYRIYRSKEETSGFVRIGEGAVNLFTDEGLPPDEKYFYRVAAESDAGFEGLASPPAGATTLKFSPPRPEAIQAEAFPTQVRLSWNPLDARYINAYLIYLKAGNDYSRIGETVFPEFTADNLTPGTDYTFYVSARSVDGIESEKTVIHAATAPNRRGGTPSR